MKSQTEFGQQLHVSDRLWQRLQALLVATACYSALDWTKSDAWMGIFPESPLWVWRLIDVAAAPLMIALMALLLARLSSMRAVSSSLLAVTLLFTLLLLEQWFYPVVTDRYWLDQLLEYRDLFLVMLLFPLISILYSRHLGALTWSQVLMVVHTILIMFICVVLTTQYHWLSPAGV